MNSRFAEAAAVVVAAGMMVLGGTVSATAQSVLYDCTFEQSRSRGGGWVPERLYLLYDTNSGAVEVIDPIIKHFVGSPVQGKRGKETAQRIGFEWTFRAKDPRNQSPPMFYRLTYYKDGRPSQMSVQPGGYDNSWSGSGVCKIGKP